jgi:hypothetical protein
MSTPRTRKTHVSLALAILLGAGMSAVSGISALAGRAVPTVSFDPPKRRKAPFSSTRQHRRHASKTYERKMPNGHVVMQTLPSYLRRNDHEVDCVLDGRLKLQVVDA